MAEELKIKTNDIAMNIDLIYRKSDYIKAAQDIDSKLPYTLSKANDLTKGDCIRVLCSTILYELRINLLKP